jgi:hypothetical protein
MRFLALLISLLACSQANAQQQVRLCFSVSGQPFCTVATSSNKMPVGAGTGGAATGVGAVQIRLCYVVPGSPFCQVVDASHPLPVQ